MKIFRLEADWGEVIEGDASDLEALGFDSSQVRFAVSTQKPYLGYVCRVVGVREKSVSDPEQEPEKKIKKVKLDDFSKLADTEKKSYGQLQLEETLGRVIRC